MAWAGWGGLPHIADGVVLPRPAATHYCKACWCSSITDDNVPCWFCGAHTSRTMPKGWLYSPSATTVHAGSSFSVDELDFDEWGIAL